MSKPMTTTEHQEVRTRLADQRRGHPATVDATRDGDEAGPLHFEISAVFDDSRPPFRSRDAVERRTSRNDKSGTQGS